MTATDDDIAFFLPECPTCRAWPMALAQKSLTGWNREAKFVCAGCGTAISLRLKRRALPIQSKTSPDPMT